MVNEVGSVSETVEVRASTEADKERLKKLDFKAKRFFGKNAAIRGLSDAED